MAEEQEKARYTEHENCHSPNKTLEGVDFVINNMLALEGAFLEGVDFVGENMTGWLRGGLKSGGCLRLSGLRVADGRVASWSAGCSLSATAWSETGQGETW